jgi:hypothetical protein
MYTDRIKSFLSAQIASNIEYGNLSYASKDTRASRRGFWAVSGNVVLSQDFYGEEIDLEGSGQHTCGLSEELLQDFVDGELDELTAHRVERHVAACKRCEKICVETKELKNLSGSLNSNVSVPTDIHHRLRAKLIEELNIDIDKIPDEV